MQTFHVSTQTPIRMDTYRLGKVLEACIQCKAFIVGYNRLNTANDANYVLLSLCFQDDPKLKDSFELMTDLKLIPVQLQERTDVQSRT